MTRTRFAPSPTGYMHIGNLKAALYCYLIAKHNDGKFILRIEDTDQERYVEGAVEKIYSTLKLAGIQHDEGPDVGGNYGPYVQSERKDYENYAKQLIEKKQAYYCFCDKDRLSELTDEQGIMHYDRKCYNLSKEEVQTKLDVGTSYVIRQFIPEGFTTFSDEVFGNITVNNDELDDQILIKTDKMPTYNFANVVDDHLMEISHIVRGSEYLSSAPKFNLLYEAFGWDKPKYIHIPLILNENGEKLSKRKGDASFEDLMDLGYLPQTVVNLVALLGWSPASNKEIFSLEELVNEFELSGLSKSPSIFDTTKLKWLNSEYIKKLSDEEFAKMCIPFIKEFIKLDLSNELLQKLSNALKTRVHLVSESEQLLSWVNEIDENYPTRLFLNTKMKSDIESSKLCLTNVIDIITNIEEWNNDSIYQTICDFNKDLGVKNGQMFHSLRVALSGLENTPCGATEIAEVIGKKETIARINLALNKINVE